MQAVCPLRVLMYLLPQAQRSISLFVVFATHWPAFWNDFCIYCYLSRVYSFYHIAHRCFTIILEKHRNVKFYGVDKYASAIIWIRRSLISTHLPPAKIAYIAQRFRFRQNTPHCKYITPRRVLSSNGSRAGRNMHIFAAGGSFVNISRWI